MTKTDTDWRPVASAPFDGSPIIMGEWRYCTRRRSWWFDYTFAKWSGGPMGHWTNLEGKGRIRERQLWMPAPELPPIGMALPEGPPSHEKGPVG